MGRVTIRLPRLGETMEEARVLDWLVAPGAAFRRGDVLLEVETDKTVVEVPALSDGVMAAHLAAPGETVALGQAIAEAEAEEAEGSPAAASDAALAPDAGAAHGAGAARPDPARGHAVPGAPPGARLPASPAASPAARAAARRAGADLAVIEGSGRRGRITAADVAAAGSGGAEATIVLLHGLFGDAKGWRDLPRRFAAAGRAVAAPDLAAGDAHADLPAPLGGLAAALAGRLPEGPLVLVGHSLGAVLAVGLARLLGPRVERLVLIAPAGIGARINRDFVEGMLAAESPAALARALALVDGAPLSQTALVAELDRLRGRRGADAALARALARDGFQQVDITADLAALACPVAVVFGTADRILDWREVGNLPAATAIHLVRGAGHLPHAAAPELIVRLAAGEPAPARRGAHG